MNSELDRAINATLMPGFIGTRLPDWLRAELESGLGSVCLFGTNVDTADQVTVLTAAIHQANPEAIVAIDEEGGDVTRLHHRTGSPHPSAAYLGHLDDVGFTERVAHSIGVQLRLVGVDMNLAPVADVNSNPRNPVIGVRSFGADADRVSRHVAATVRGLQRAGVAAVAKHFPGHGDTTADSHHELPLLAADAATLTSRELAPFRAAIQAGTLGVMTSHILLPAFDATLPATLAPAVVSGLLREDLGFHGVVVSDALDMAGASATRGIPEAAVLSLVAGVDLLCLGTATAPDLLAKTRARIREAIGTGRLSAQRVFDAASRIRAMRSRLADTPGTPSAVPSEPHVSSAGFAIRRPLTPLREPVLIRLLSAANMAAGDTVWGIGEHLGGELATALPGARWHDAATREDVDTALDAAAGKPLVCLGRDLARVPFLRESVQRIRDRRPDAVVVDLGWPDLSDEAAPEVDVATFGAGRATATALIQLLKDGR